MTAAGFRVPLPRRGTSSMPIDTLAQMRHIVAPLVGRRLMCRVLVG